MASGAEHGHRHIGGHGTERFAGPLGLVIALSMLVGRGRTSRLVADRASVEPGDHVLDVGCGPGSAAREAARRGAAVTGVDPVPLMLRLGRLLSRGKVAYLRGTAEAIPMPDESVTAAWAMSSAHHWADVPAGLREVHRVLAPGGRLVITERLTRTGAGGLASHGFTQAQAERFARFAREAGFAEVSTETVPVGRRTLSVIRARRAA